MQCPLLNKLLIRNFACCQTDPGRTILPIKMYFKQNRFLKNAVSLCRSKQLHHLRKKINQREDDRNMNRVIKATLSGLSCVRECHLSQWRSCRGAASLSFLAMVMTPNV